MSHRHRGKQGNALADQRRYHDQAIFANQTLCAEGIDNLCPTYQPDPLVALLSQGRHDSEGGQIGDCQMCPISMG
ncbi:MAG: hypothetical protein O3C67_07435 [Cyanobacteria bacterium]|nr:hypothetical protein [Cyanobacteriota bacterium]